MDPARRNDAYRAEPNHVQLGDGKASGVRGGRSGVAARRDELARALTTQGMETPSCEG
jgi:hypothetical protein